jgi:hypothetical protein
MTTKECPAPRANVGNRAKLNGHQSITNGNQSAWEADAQSDVAAVYVAQRYKLALPLARIVAALASLGRALS